MGPDPVPPPPRWLWYGCLSTIVMFLLGLLAVFLFYTRVLTPGQRESAKNRLPFLAPLFENFDPPLPPPDLRLPTPLPGGARGEILLTIPPRFLQTPSATPSPPPPHRNTATADGYGNRPTYGNPAESHAIADATPRQQFARSGGDNGDELPAPDLE